MKVNYIGVIWSESEKKVFTVWVGIYKRGLCKVNFSVYLSLWLTCEILRLFPSGMATHLGLVSTLDAETRVVQRKLLAYVQAQLSNRTRVHAAEMVEKEEGWGREREMLYRQIAELEADREAEKARVKGAGGLNRGTRTQSNVDQRLSMWGCHVGRQPNVVRQRESDTLMFDIAHNSRQCGETVTFFDKALEC